MKTSKFATKNTVPTLRFSPTAWAKFVYLRDITGNEVGGFGISDPDDLLFIQDIVLVKQKVTVVSVSFLDESVADFFDHQVEVGHVPQQFARIWLHTHPGNSPSPSMTDEETFRRVFGSCDWSIMCILAQDGSTFARLQFNAGPGGNINLHACVNYNCSFEAADPVIWKQEYLANVMEERLLVTHNKPEPKELQSQPTDIFGGEEVIQETSLSPDDLLDQIDSMDPLEREFFMEELAIHAQYWNLESEVFNE